MTGSGLKAYPTPPPSSWTNPDGIPGAVVAAVVGGDPLPVG